MAYTACLIWLLRYINTFSVITLDFGLFRKYIAETKEVIMVHFENTTKSFIWEYKVIN